MEKISVLYVDDEPALLQLAKLFLERTGSVDLTGLTSAAEALDHLRIHRYDAIVSDYQMPGTDGIEFLKQFRACSDNTPFILFTGRGREEVVIEALNNGADSYIQKGGDPITQFAELQQKIKLTVERRQAQVALQESEKKYRQLVENAKEGIFIIQDEKFIFFNPKFLEIIESSRLPREEVLTSPFFTFIHPDEKEMVRDRYFQRIDQNKNFPPYAFRFLSKNGDVRWGEVDAIRIEWNGRPATLNFYRDITEQYNLREQVSESESRYKDLVESLPKTIIEFNDQFFLTFINKAGLDKFGYSPDELKMKFTPMDFVSPEERDNIREIYQKAKDGEQIQVHETWGRKKDGTTFPLVVYLSCTRQKNRVSGFRVIGIDISESKQLRDKLVQANAKLNLVIQITRHDISNKLTALRAYQMLAMRQNHTKKAGFYLQKIEDIADTIRKQLEFTKMYLEIGQYEPEWLNVEDIVVRSLHQLPTQNLHCNMDLKGLEIYADLLLVKAIYNLIDNTLRHGKHATEITVFFDEKAPRPVLVYEDNGIGIAEDDKPQLFTRGFGNNTGLGLFLIREILAITGITITENGVPEKGARFEIHLPEGKYRKVPALVHETRTIVLP